MTENEANMSIKHAVCVLETIGNGLTLRNENDREDACVLAIKSLEEIQQYRAIGTVEDVQEIFSLCKTLQEIVKKYSAIGTIEEFKALKEKSVAKKIKGIRFTEAICPRCESELFDTYWAFGGIHYCSNCGQTIDWQ